MTVEAAPGRAVSGRQVASPRAVLVVASLGVVMAFLDATIVNVAFPDIRLSFPATGLDGLSWILNAYNIVFAAFLVPAGRIADLVGRKKLFQVGVVVFTLASLLCAVAPSVGTLVAARILQALGAAILVPASLAIVLEAFPDEERAHGVALWSATAALAAGIGPSLGGALVELASWRLVFLVNLPVGAVAVVVAGRTLVESRAPGRRRIPDLPGALLLAVGTALLTLAIVKGQDWGWANVRVVGSFAASIALAGLFAWRCTWHGEPIVDLSLLRVRALSVANGLTFAGAAGFYAYVLCNVLFLTSVWRYSVLDAGLALTPGPFVAAAVANPAGRLAERVGARLVLAVGGVIWAGGVAYMALRVGAQPQFLSEWLPGMLILGVGAGIVFPVVGATAVAPAPSGRFATATGLNSIARQLGAAMGVALLVAIVGTPSPADLTDAFDRGWIFAAGCFVAVAVGALALGRVEGPSDQRSEPRRRTSSVSIPTQPVPASRPSPSRPRPRTTAELLEEVPLLAPLPERRRAELAERAGARRVKAGAWLFRQGDPGDSLYVVAAGRLEVVQERDGELLTLRELGPGAVLGELALVAGSPRSASVRARRESQLLELTRQDFDALLRETPSFGSALMKEMALQLQESRALAPPGRALPSILALVPMGQGVPLGEVADRLERSLAAYGSLARLDEAPADAPVETFERLEREHERLLLVADSPDPRDDWTALCLRQADRVLCLAGPEPAPERFAADEVLRDRDLLWVTGPPGSMASWLEALAPRARYVLQADSLGPSIGAAARRLTGHSLGLALSGGGARALAHVGVIEELVEAGVTIDRVSGVSMGSLVGALFASGLNPEELDARIYDEWVRRNPLNDYRFPRHSLVKGDKVRAAIQRMLPGTVEELPREFACISADLKTGEEIVHRSGELWGAVGSSMSLPGLVAPLPHQGRLQVDGAVAHGLPLHLLSREEGRLIAADVTARPGGGNGREQSLRIPTIGETMFRVALLGGVGGARTARREADLLIVPSDAGVGLLEFHQLDQAKEAGRRAVAEALEQAPPELFL